MWLYRRFQKRITKVIFGTRDVFFKQICIICLLSVLLLDADVDKLSSIKSQTISLGLTDCPISMRTNQHWCCCLETAIVSNYTNWYGCVVIKLYLQNHTVGFGLQAIICWPMLYAKQIYVISILSLFFHISYLLLLNKSFKAQMWSYHNIA